MSDHTPDTETPDTSEQATTPEIDTDTGETRPANREAKYRKQLREAEAQRDGLAERVETMQRAEVERLAADLLAKPAALWATGRTLADLLDQDGNVDPDKVTEAATDATTALGAAAPPSTPRPDPTQGGMGSTRTNTWTDAFRWG